MPCIFVLDIHDKLQHFVKRTKRSGTRKTLSSHLPLPVAEAQAVRYMVNGGGL